MNEPNGSKISDVLKGGKTRIGKTGKQGMSPRKDGKALPRGTDTPKAVPILVSLYESQILFLDRITLAIREKSGESVKRAALIRAIIDAIQEAGLGPRLEIARNENDVKDKLKECFVKHKN
jgi:hypothetical protein